MDRIECSFCGTSLPSEEAKDHVVAGPTVFICRDCVDLCIGTFSEQDASWRDTKIEQLEALRDNK